MSQVYVIKTLREANKIAKEMGLVRCTHKYNGQACWKTKSGAIVTRRRLDELAGYQS